MPIQTQNLATGEVLKTFTAHTDAQVDAAIAKAQIAQHELRDWSFQKRKQAMEKMADILQNEAEAFAEIITLEMGKPYLQAVREVKKCASVCRYYAEYAEAHLESEYIETEASQSYRAFFPLGIIMAVMPWNFPFWQVFRFAAPALMAGNTTLLKHASNVPQCALAMEDIFNRAGFPKGALMTLLVGSGKVERILRDDRIRAASLTGSEPAGASVASICGSEIKPTVLGLGSSVWTQDKDEQDKAIRGLEAGATFVNAMTSSHPYLPFGGIKKSGYGRELAEEGVRRWSNVKTVYIT